MGFCAASAIAQARYLTSLWKCVNMRKHQSGDLMQRWRVHVKYVARRVRRAWRANQMDTDGVLKRRASVVGASVPRIRDGQFQMVRTDKRLRSDPRWRNERRLTFARKFPPANHHPRTRGTLVPTTLPRRSPRHLKYIGIAGILLITNY